MFIVNENEKEYRFGDSGPKYLMKGPRMNFALVQFGPGQDFKAHYHNVMEENFFILEGEIDIVVDGKVNPVSYTHLAVPLALPLPPVESVPPSTHAVMIFMVSVLPRSLFAVPRYEVSTMPATAALTALST